MISLKINKMKLIIQTYIIPIYKDIKIYFRYISNQIYYYSQIEKNISRLINQMSTSTIKIDQFHLKPPFKNKTQQFQQKCGECLLAMEQYKLKSHFLGCNMSKQQLNKYYNHYQTKPRKRLQLIKNKLQSLMHTFERNAIYLQALQLKSLNNMMKAYRKRMNLSSNQPTAYSFTKFQLDQQELTDLIILNDTTKLPDIQKIINKIKIAEQNAAATLQQKLQSNKTKKPYFARVLKTINKCQVHYYKKFQTFERSIVNMINQIHSHMQKLNQFYTLCENLGTSIIYQMKSDRQVLIDKTAEQRYSKNYLNMDQDEDQIMQVIDIVPPGSKVYQNYKQKLQNIRTKSSRIYANNTSTSFSQAILNKKNKKGNLKIPIQSINKVSWYQTESQDLKQYNFNGNILLKEKEDGFFRYTFEELHHETNQYLDQIKNKNAFQENNQRNPNDRFFLYCQKQIKKKSSDPVFKLQKYNVPPHMNFNCWYDRIGSKGAFAIQDFPMNMFQRKLQFELDRQIEMNDIDEKLRKQYYAKQSKLNIRLDSSVCNIGYRELNQAEQTRKMREYLINLYDPDNFPLIKPQSNKSKYKDELDFSDSDEQQKDKNTKNIKMKQQQIEDQLQIAQKKDKLKQVNEHIEQNQNKHKYSNQLSNKLQQHQKSLSKLLENRNEPKFKILVQNVKNTYPWLQIKQKQKQSIQVFVQRYLPQYDKMLTNKIKNDVLTMGYTEDEVQMVSFKYLQNYQLDVIEQCIYSTNVPIDNNNNIKIQRQNLNKIYLLNSKLYVKIQPLFFHQSTKIIKIYICMISQFAQFQKLKSNLEKVLLFYGKCKFHLNLDLIDSKYGDQQKLYGLIGHLIRNLKLDKNLKNIFESCDNNIDYLQVIKQGKKVYQAFTTYQNYLKQK